MIYEKGVASGTRTITFANPWDALFFEPGCLFQSPDDFGPLIMTHVYLIRGAVTARTSTSFERRRYYAGKAWVGRRYEMPATQRRRMERDRRAVD